MTRKNLLSKRIFSIILALTVALSMMPVTAFADDDVAVYVAEVTIDGTATSYTDIDAAFAEAVAADGSTLKMLDNVTTDTEVTVSSGTHTLDLNGKTLTSTTTDDGFLYISGGTLTIQDSASGGAITSVKSTLRVNDGGALIVTGGSFTSQDTNGLIVFNGGSAQLSGGTFDSKGDTHSIWVMNSGKAANLLAAGYRYMKATDTTQKSSYSDGGNGVVGATTVCEIPEGEVTYIGADGSEQTQAGCTELTGKGFAGTNYDGIYWFAAKGNVAMEDVLSAHGTINLILCDGATVTAPKGVAFESNADQPATLNIFAQSAGTGELVANGVADTADMTAGIRNASSSSGEMTLNIYGGTVKATGAKCDVNPGYPSYSGAGIGTCVNDTSGNTMNVKIYGGTVIAQSSGEGGAAIGNGQGSTATVKVTIADGMKCVKTATPTEKAEYSNTDGISVTITKCGDHQWGYTDNKDDMHTKTCALCGTDGGTEEHSFKNWKADEGGTTHTGTCVCGKESTEAHTLSYVITSTTHKQECNVCGYETAEAAHSFAEATGKCVCGADADIAVEKVAVTITKPDGTVTTTNYTDILKAFYDADEGRATKVEVKLLQSNKTYTLDSEKAYPIKFEYTNGVDVIVDLNGCTLKRSVPNSGYGILKVEKGDVTFQNGTLELDGSASAQAIKLLATGNKPTLTLKDMTVKAAQGIAIYAGDGKLNIESGTYGEVQIHSAEVKLSGGSYTEVEHLFNKYAEMLETGYIFAKQDDSSYIAPSDMGYDEASKDWKNIKNIKVIKCEHQGAPFTDGKCGHCGYICTKHTPKSGSCKTCGRTLVANDGINDYVSLNEAFANVAEKDTILDIIALTEETAAFNDNKDVTLILNGHPVKGNADDAATLTVEGGKLTIINGVEGSTIVDDPAVITNNGKGFAVCVTGGTLKFDSKATITGGLQVIKDGKLEGGLKEGSILIAGTGNAMDGGSASSVSVRDSVGNTNYGIVLDLLGEGLAFAKYNGSTSDNPVGDIVNGHVSALTENVIVVKHTHSSDAEGECACGFVCEHEDASGASTIGTDGKCTVCGAQMVAKDGSGKYYADLSDALDGVTDGGTVTMLADVEDYVTITDNTTVTIDLNEKTWKSVYWGAVVPLTVNGGSVTVKNGTLDQGNASSYANTAVVVNGGSLIVGEGITIQGGKADSRIVCPAITVESGSLTLTVGTALYGGMKVTVEGKLIKDYLPEGTAFAMNGSVINGYVQEMTGDFTLTVMEHTHIFDVDGKCACGASCTHTDINSETGKCNLCNKQAHVAAVIKGENTTTYATAQEAISNGSGGTVKLLADAGELTVSSALKLDCNGHTIATLTVNEGVTLESLLQEGYAFKSGDKWLSDSELSGKNELEKVTTAEAPVKSVTAENPTIKVKYGESYTLSTTFAWTGSTDSSNPRIKWEYKSGEYLHEQTPTLSGYETNSRTMDYEVSTTGRYPAQVGTYTYVVTFTKDGYSKSCEFTVTIEKAESVVTTAPAAKKDLTYSGSAQELITPGTTEDGKLVYSLIKDGTYTETIPTSTDADTYTVWYMVKGDTNHNDSTPQSLTATIAPRKLSEPASSGSVTKKYDGSTALPSNFELEGFIDASESGTQTIKLTKGTDYTMTGGYDTATVDSGKVVTLTITLTNKNYIFEGNVKTKIFTINGTDITKADAPTNLIPVDITQKFSVTEERTASATEVGIPQDAGTVTYAKGTDSAIDKVQSWKVDGTTGTVTYTLSGGQAGDKITLPVKISSTNYEDATASIVITLTDKDVPTVTAEDLTVTYDGNLVSPDKIQGTATFEGKTVEGTWRWKEGMAVTNAADSGEKTVIFTPKDTENYAVVEKNIHLTINKATPTGAPKYTAIKEAGKKLLDAALTAIAEGKNLFSTDGYIAWVDAEDQQTPLDVNTTEVQQGEAYRWLFTPSDVDNFNKLTGTIILWAKPSSGGGGGAVTPTTPDTDVVTVKDDKTGATESGDPATTTTTKTTVSETKTETTKNEQGETVSKTTAAVSKETAEKLVDQAVSNKSDTVEITVKSSTPAGSDAGATDGVKSTELEIPKSTVEEIAKNTDADLVIKTDSGEVTLDNKTLETIAKEAKGDTVTIVVNENTKLTDAQKPAEKIIGEKGKLFDLAASIGEKLLHHFDGGKAHVTLPMPEGLKGKDVLVIYINDKGFCEILSHAVEKVGADSYIKFTTSHFSTFAVVDKEEAEALIKAQNDAHVKELMKTAKFKVTTSKTGKKSVKVTVTVKNSKTLISDIKTMGYTVKYQFYRSTKKASGYKLLKTKTTNSFTNTTGKKGTKYYYKARVLVYDGKTLVAKSELKQASYGTRTWTK